MKNAIQLWTLRSKQMTNQEIIRRRTPELGLSRTEARTRLNTARCIMCCRSTPPASLGRRFVEQFRSPLIYVLLGALLVDITIWVVEGHSGWPFESVAIALILLLNAGLGVYQESKAEAALARLKALAETFVWVMRDGRLIRLPSAELVPGDLVRLEAGDRVPADGNLAEAYAVMVDESVLTGESLPIDKENGNEVLSGTLLTRGKGYLEVTSHRGRQRRRKSRGDDRSDRGGAYTARAATQTIWNAGSALDFVAGRGNSGRRSLYRRVFETWSRALVRCRAGRRRHS